MEETALCPQNICPDNRFEAWSLFGQVMGFGWEGWGAAPAWRHRNCCRYLGSSPLVLANLAAGRGRPALKCSHCLLQIFHARKNYFRADEPYGWAVSFRCHTSSGIKWGKVEQLRDKKKKKFAMDACYSKVKAMRCLYGREENMDLQLIKGFRQVPELSTPTNMPQPKHTSN